MHDYIAPETDMIILEHEKSLCQSGALTSGTSLENFDSEDTDFLMF